MANASNVVVRLRRIPSVGLLTATALVAFIGDVQRRWFCGIECV
jgi:hypothetical protein